MARAPSGLSRKARVWIGVTLFVVISFNYLAIALPLKSRSDSIKARAEDILFRKVKAGNALSGSDEDYVLDIFRKEKLAIDKKIFYLNCIAVSMAIVVLSWTLFGFFMRKRS